VAKTKVINLVAGPGAGKSTTAAGLFFEMKCRGYKVELVTEYAKELCYEGRLQRTAPLEIVEEQLWRQVRLRMSEVEFVVTDAPLLISGFYAPEVADYAKKCFDEFDNFNVFISRTKPYATYGREQTEDEARELDARMQSALHRIFHLSVSGDRNAHLTILSALEAHCEL
jgi:hypothetical protein